MAKNKQKRWTLHHYWCDGCTIEYRYFPTKKAAENFAKDNGYVDYIID